MIDKYEKTIMQVLNAHIDNVLSGQPILPGHNGPYYDEETEVRNTAHWISLYAFGYARTNESKYKEAVAILAEKLYSSPYLYPNYVYVSRNSEKDTMNGTVGPAWIIEGLLKASTVLNDEKYCELAVNVFKSQKYVSRNCLWTRITEQGKDIGFDLTYNHELWFAAAGALILDYKYDAEIDKQVREFLQMSLKGFRILPDGIINHYVDTWVGLKRAISFNKRYYSKLIADISGKPSMRYKEEGYHLFSMYAFAMLQKRYADHPFFKSNKFKKALAITFKKEFLDKLDNANTNLDITKITKEHIDKKLNAYAYPYNAPGFELPYIAHVFFANDGDKETTAKGIFQKQMDYTFNGVDGFTRNTEDGVVLTARLYELTRVYDESK